MIFKSRILLRISISLSPSSCPIKRIKLTPSQKSLSKLSTDLPSLPESLNHLIINSIVKAANVFTDNTIKGLFQRSYSKRYHLINVIRNPRSPSDQFASLIFCLNVNSNFILSKLKLPRWRFANCRSDCLTNWSFSGEWSIRVSNPSFFIRNPLEERVLVYIHSNINFLSFQFCYTVNRDII